MDQPYSSFRRFVPTDDPALVLVVDRDEAGDCLVQRGLAAWAEGRAATLDGPPADDITASD